MAALAAERWDLPRAKKNYAGLYTDGRTGPGGPRVGVLLPQTFMNDSGSSVEPGARRARRRPRPRGRRARRDRPAVRPRRVPPRRRARRPQRAQVAQGAGWAAPDFHRIRVGVGRPDSTDPEIVSAHVLGRFSEPQDEVRALVERAADELERLSWVTSSE